MNCPKCLIKYNKEENLPRILNGCGHSLCQVTHFLLKDCLIYLFSCDLKMKIVCPICKIETTTDDVRSLTKNMAIIEQINTFDLSSTNLTQDIGRNDQCSQHKKDIEIFCENCRQMLCVTCIIETDHKQHDLISIEKAALREKEKLKNILVSLQITEEKLKHKTDDLDKSLKVLENDYLRKIKNVEDFFDEIQKIIEKRKNELIEKTETECKNKINELFNLRDNSLCTIDTIREINNITMRLEEMKPSEIILTSESINMNMNDINNSVNQTFNVEIFEQTEVDLDKDITFIKKQLNKFTTNRKTKKKISKNGKEELKVVHSASAQNIPIILKSPFRKYD